MAQRDDLAGAGDALRRDERRPAVVEPVGEEGAQRGRDAGGAVEEAGEPEQERAADDLRRERRAGPRAAGEQRALEGELGVRLERGAGEGADPGVDAVGAPALVEVGEQPGARGLHARERGGVDRDRLVVEHDPAVAVGVERAEDDHR